MIVKSLHKLPVLCLLFFSLLTSPASSLGYVWCVSDDGHATLEAAMAGVCAMDYPAPIKAAPPAPALIVGVDDCGLCFDVSSSDQWGPPESGRIEILDNFLDEFAPVSVVAHPPRPDNILNNHAITDTTPRTPAPILYHRTIVLLI